MHIASMAQCLADVLLIWVLRWSVALSIEVTGLSSRALATEMQMPQTHEYGIVEPATPLSASIKHC